MSNTYKTGDRVPTSTLADRLDELSEAVTKGDTSPFVMRIPAELDHCPDLVMSQSAVRMRELDDRLNTVEIVSNIYRAQFEKAERGLNLRAQDFRFMCESAQQVEALLGIKSNGGTGMEPIMEEVEQLKAERDRLLDGYPEGMTPTDVRKLKEYNAELAQENGELKVACGGLMTQRDVARTQLSLIENTKTMAKPALAESYEDLRRQFSNLWTAYTALAKTVKFYQDRDYEVKWAEIAVSAGEVDGLRAANQTLTEQLLAAEAGAGFKAQLDALQRKSEHLQSEAQCQAKMANTLRATVFEIYKAAGVQKGDWNGGRPIIEKLAYLNAKLMAEKDKRITADYENKTREKTIRSLISRNVQMRRDLRAHAEQPEPCKAVKSEVISGVRMDELDASLEVEAWFADVIERRNYRAESSSCMRHHGFEAGCGKVAVLWVNNRPVATAVLLRDEFNYTTFFGSELDWPAVSATTEQQP
uniref:hypothetical protein n=1 Tax=Marinobacterium profundum TaxID=1714300 RepID=UPI0008369DB1|nr:hypothetical protein [Marinobacterium profundum]